MQDEHKKIDYKKEILVKGLGIDAISYILHYVDNMYFKGDVFPEPKVIYRGVTAYYPRKENGEIVKGEKVIQSALAYRLQEYCYKGYNRSTYISKLKQMISDARISFPNEYRGQTDLTVLADIQHNGGATCLVDFSKNILKSLWFACEREFDKDGYLYCYNIMHDSIINNNLTWIKDNDNRDIEMLLTASSRFANVCSDVTNRFYYWTPPALNNRIVSQDSIFIFGLDRFEIEKHKILMFKIPAASKESIKKALEIFFNIHSFSIYNDISGYAISKARTNPIAQTDGVNNFNYVFVDILNFMQNEDYTSAASLIRRYQGQREYEGISEREEMELHYSMGICYKKSRLNDRAEYEIINSIEEFKKVIEISNKCIVQSKKELRGEKDPDKRTEIIKDLEYLSRKCVRAYNEIIDLCYDSLLFTEGMQVCDEIIKNYKNLMFKTAALSLSVCRITRMELYILSRMHKKGYEDTRFLESENSSIEIANSKNAFDKLLIGYYMLFDELLNDYRDDKGIIESIKKITNFKKKLNINETKKYLHDYYYWEFLDILKALGHIEVRNGDNSILYINVLKDLTSAMISFRDILESQLMLKNTRF